jgi:glyoxylase-like metal-dependent hydrolase (beta-lactamase superfamily II)
MTSSKSRKWLFGAFILLGACCTASAQAPAPPLQLIVHPIKAGKLYWVEGGGGNSGVIIGNDGVVVIDAKISAEAGKALIAEIAKLTPKPITHLIETHSDGDHVNGAAAFPDGVKIIAHANNRNEQLIEPLFAAVEVGGGKCLPPADRLPNQLVYKDKVSATLDGERMEFLHFGPAHTTGDLIVYLPDDKIVFAGDILTFNVLVHPEKHGSLDGWFKTAKALLALNATTYIPGHATEPDSKEMLRKRIAELQAKRGKIDGLIDAGKSLDEIKTAMGDPATDRPGCRGIPYPPVSWVEYQDRKGRAAELK